MTFSFKEISWFFFILFFHNPLNLVQIYLNSIYDLNDPTTILDFLSLTKNNIFHVFNMWEDTKRLDKLSYFYWFFFLKNFTENYFIIKIVYLLLKCDNVFEKCRRLVCMFIICYTWSVYTFFFQKKKSRFWWNCKVVSHKKKKEKRFYLCITT